MVYPRGNQDEPLLAAGSADLISGMLVVREDQASPTGEFGSAISINWLVVQINKAG
jgi:hypothetical protein